MPYSAGNNLYLEGVYIEVKKAQTCYDVLHGEHKMSTK